MPGPEGDKAREGEGEGGRELLFSRRQLAACLVVVFAPRPHFFLAPGPSLPLPYLRPLSSFFALRQFRPSLGVQKVTRSHPRPLW